MMRKRDVMQPIIAVTGMGSLFLHSKMDAETTGDDQQDTDIWETVITECVDYERDELWLEYREIVLSRTRTSKTILEF